VNCNLDRSEENHRTLTWPNVISLVRNRAGPRRLAQTLGLTVS